MPSSADAPPSLLLCLSPTGATVTKPSPFLQLHTIKSSPVPLAAAGRSGLIQHRNDVIPIPFTLVARHCTCRLCRP